MTFTDEEKELLKGLDFDDYLIEIFEKKQVNVSLIKELQDLLLDQDGVDRMSNVDVNNVNTLIYGIINDRLSPGYGEGSTVGINELLRVEIDRIKEGGNVLLNEVRGKYILPIQGGRRKSRRARKSRRGRKSRKSRKESCERYREIWYFRTSTETSYSDTSN